MRFRDRFFSPKVARAITSPSAILATGAGAALGLLALGPGGAILGGVAFLVGRVALAIPRAPQGARIDPFALSEPWRRLVQDAQRAQAQFRQAVRDTRPGPLRDRLVSIGEGVDEGVDECWQIARAGHQLAAARRRVDLADAQRDLAELDASGATGPTADATRAAAQAQISAAARMDATITETRDRLRLLNARLDEAVTRVIELSVAGTDVGGLDRVNADVASITMEMEALRQGIEATEGLSGGMTAGGTG